MIGNSWDNIILGNKYNRLEEFIKKERKTNTVYPKDVDVFKALRLTNYDSVKVVIIGQDPYHDENEANGLAFSVNNGVKAPPSLKNIFKELYNDLNIKRTNTDLSDWAKDGVLLLNSILTVVKDRPLSHKNIGWEQLTDNIIELLNKKEEPIVFILWGNYARSKKVLINNKRHLVIEGVHPSPLSASRGFFGSKPFSKTNSFLESNGISKIKW